MSTKSPNAPCVIRTFCSLPCSPQLHCLACSAMQVYVVHRRQHHESHTWYHASVLHRCSRHPPQRWGSRPVRSVMWLTCTVCRSRSAQSSARVHDSANTELARTVCYSRSTQCCPRMHVAMRATNQSHVRGRCHARRTCSWQ